MKKILVAGNIKGQFKEFFEKVNQLNNKNQFDFVLCVGQTFKENENIGEFLKTNQQLITVPTYLIDYSEVSNFLCELYPQGLELAPNLFFLGKSGIKKIQGINVAFLNGMKYNNDIMYSSIQQDKIKFSGQYYSGKDIQNIIEQFEVLQQNGEIGENKGVDILINSEWPRQVVNNEEWNRLGLGESEEIKSDYLGELVDSLSPRYHFVSCVDVFYQRAPYLNSFGYLTRFFSISGFPQPHQPNKHKYLYAFQLLPINQINNHDLYQPLPQVGNNPYIKQTTNSQFQQNANIQHQPIQKYQQVINSQENYIQQVEEVQQVSENQSLYFGGIDKKENYDQVYEFMERFGEVEYLQLDSDSSHKRWNKGWGYVHFKQLSTTNQALLHSGKYALNRKSVYFNIKERKCYSDCWFCPDGNQFDYSIVVEQLEHFYVSLDKGPIHPFHLQIVPKEHVQSPSQLSPQALVQLTIIRQKIIQLFQNNHFNSHVIFYQKYLPLKVSYNHFLIHAIPIHTSISNDIIKKFESFNKDNHLDFVKLDNQKNETVQTFLSKNKQKQNVDQGFYLSFELNDNSYVMMIDARQYFKQKGFINHELMRKLVNYLLDKQQLNWRDVQLSETQKKQQIQILQPFFK